MKIQYNEKFKSLIERKLSSNYKLYSDAIMKICSSFYNLYFPKNEKTQTIDIYNSYYSRYSESQKKFIIISLNPDIEFKTDKDFIDYNLDNDNTYKHYGFDSENNIFFAEKQFYIIYDLFCSDKYNEKTAKFIDFINIVVAYYDEENNSFYISKKPTIKEIFSENFKQKGDIKENFYINNIKIPKWLYCKKADTLTIDEYITINNADVKAEFIKKAGIDKLIAFGKVVDSYENYPDNEWWEKSEYKLIDMHNVLPPKKIVYEWNRRIKLQPWTYAPFLYMKNQTTGVIHLEGINPKCRNLYDALKMRYKGLNLPIFEIKDIK